MPRSNGEALTPADFTKVSVNQARDMLAFAEGRQTPFGVKVPKFATPITAIGYATGLVYGTQVQLAQYTAKAGYYVVFSGLVLQFMGGGPSPNPGDVTFTVDIDRPLGDTTGHAEKDYGAVPILLGSFTQGWVWPVEFRISNSEVIRVKGLPVANMGIGAGNWLIAALLGFEWPQQGYEGF